MEITDLGAEAARAVVASQIPPPASTFQQPPSAVAGRRRDIHPPIAQSRRNDGYGEAIAARALRFGARARGDPQLLLAVAVTVPIGVLLLSGLTPGVAVGAQVVLAPALFLGAQLWMTSLRPAPAWLPTARLWLSLAFVMIANLWADPAGTLPIRALILPVVALAAARGGLGPGLVVLTGLGTMALPLLGPSLDIARRQSIVAVTLAAIVMAIGSRSVVRSLERSRARLQQANARDRRHARQLDVVESVGRLLAREGPTTGILDHLMLVLEQTFGYRYPSVYVWDGAVLRLGAQRNYAFPIAVFSPDVGVIGRVARTRAPVFLPDVRTDADFVSAHPEVTGEIGVPLLSDGDLLGVLNVETGGDRPLTRSDFAIMQIVGDRLAAALALGRGRQALTERAALLDRLTTFSTALGSSLDPSTMDDEVASGAKAVIPADIVVLVDREPEPGSFTIRAVAATDTSMIGKPLLPGEGVSWRAITSRSVVVDEHLESDRYPGAAATAALPPIMSAMSAPMVAGAEVVGAVTWLRADLGHPFTSQEREIAGLLAGKVALALVNARLHQQVRDAAVRDPLTGLFNRRHFDTAVEREDALRRRVPAERRGLRSVILFDLDHFGMVNKRHGHQVGDRVLRLFADTLRTRARAADLVARYGGEEFVVILDGAGRDDAVTIAEDVRAAFATREVETSGGERLTNTVSAGCAALEAWEVEGSVLLERADVALAMAKAAGRDKVVAA